MEYTSTGDPVASPGHSGTKPVPSFVKGCADMKSFGVSDEVMSARTYSTPRYSVPCQVTHATQHGTDCDPPRRVPARGMTRVLAGLWRRPKPADDRCCWRLRAASTFLMGDT